MNVALLSSLLVLAVVAGTANADRCWYKSRSIRWFYAHFGYRNLGSYRYWVYVSLWRSKSCTHGQWSEWKSAGVKGACSEECGTGTRSVEMMRTCTNPPPSNDGLTCSGSFQKMHSENCNEQECKVDGGWSDWMAWKSGKGQECSALCGGGSLKQHRIRYCSNPKPQNGGEDCVGASRENQSIDCNKEECGDKCPTGQVKYLAHQTRATRFYQCEHGIAKLHQCGENTEWNQEGLSCGHAVEQEDDDEAEITDCKGSTQNLLAHPNNCRMFLQCVHGKAVVHTCAAALHFNDDSMVCMQPSAAGCDQESETVA